MRLARDAEGKPMFSPDGRGVRVERDGLPQCWANVASLPGDLPPGERGEVAEALGKGPVRPQPGRRATAQPAPKPAGRGVAPPVAARPVPATHRAPVAPHVPADLATTSGRPRQARADREDTTPRSRRDELPEELEARIAKARRIAAEEDLAAARARRLAATEDRQAREAEGEGEDRTTRARGTVGRAAWRAYLWSLLPSYGAMLAAVDSGHAATCTLWAIAMQLGFIGVAVLRWQAAGRRAEAEARAEERRADYLRRREGAR